SPKRACNCRVTPKTPPLRPISSPSMRTFSSASISSEIASPITWEKRRLRMGVEFMSYACKAEAVEIGSRGEGIGADLGEHRACPRGGFLAPPLHLRRG